MFWPVVALTSPVWAPMVLLALFFVGIQYERGGWWWLLAPLAALALVVDVALAHTLLALWMRDYPQLGEWTYSKQVARLARRKDPMALYVAGILNAIAPRHDHINLTR